jgi:hypothetical protein
MRSLLLLALLAVAIATPVLALNNGLGQSSADRTKGTVVQSCSLTVLSHMLVWHSCLASSGRSDSSDGMELVS